VTFIMNEFEVESAQLQAAHDFHRPTFQRAVLTLSRLVEWTNLNSDGWAYWSQPTAASAKLQKLVDSGYALHRHPNWENDLTAAELKAAYTPIKSFLTRQNVPHSTIFIND